MAINSFVTHTKHIKFACFMSQSIPSVTIPPPGSPGQIFKICQIPTSQVIFSSNARLLGFPGNLYFNKFYTFPPLSKSQSMTIYKFVEENIYLSMHMKKCQNCKSLNYNLICIEYYYSLSWNTRMSLVNHCLIYLMFCGWTRMAVISKSRDWYWVTANLI